MNQTSKINTTMFTDAVPTKGIFTAKVSKLTLEEIEKTAPFHRGKKTKIKFLGYLVNVHGLYAVRKGKSAQLCSVTIGKALGISTQTVCNYIKQLVGLKWIKTINSTWKVGKRSRSFICSCVLLRSMHVKRWIDKAKTKGVVKLLKRALTREGLKEKRSAAWSEAVPELIKLGDEVAESETQSVTADQRQKYFKYYVGVAKNYLGLPFDMLRDLDKFLIKHETLRASHQELFYQANKALYKQLKIRKTFTREMFSGDQKHFSPKGRLFTVHQKPHQSFLSNPA